MSRYDRNNEYHEWLEAKREQYEGQFGYVPRTTEQENLMDEALNLMNEQRNLQDRFYSIPQNKPFREVNNYQYPFNINAFKQRAALTRMLAPGPNGLTLKEQILAATVSPEKIQKELARQGVNLNTASVEQMNKAFETVYEGGPTVKNVGKGPRGPTRRENRERRRLYSRLTMKKHLRPVNLTKPPMTNLGKSVRYRNYENILGRLNELNPRINDLLQRIHNLEGGRRQTRRNRRLF